MPLAKYSEQGWPVGVWRNGSAEAEPSGALGDLLGLLGDDSLPFKRGGASYKSNAAAGTGLLMLADLVLAAGQRTMFAPSGNSVYQLAADGVTPALITSAALGASPLRSAVVAGLAPIDAGFGLFGGSRKTATYTTGTVTVTNGSTAVTGAGTLWAANADAGMILYYSPTGHSQAVAKVNGDTSLTLHAPWSGPSGAGVAYRLDLMSTGVSGGSGRAPDFPVMYAAAANRLLYGSGNVLQFSPVLDPLTRDSTNQHTFPGTLLGIGPLRDAALVFTTAGVWAISGLAYNLFDNAGNPQQRNDLLNADLIAWGHEGIAPWSGALVVPAVDGQVWLMDATAAPVAVGDPVRDLLRSYVTAGYKPGVAEVFRDHYLLPILNASNVWQDTLVCRLRPARGGGGPAWARLSGTGVQVTTFAERTTSPPVLLGASTAAASRVLDCTGYFAPAAGNRNDGDGTAVPFQMYTRAIPTGDNQGFNTVRRVELNYALADTGAPSITAEYQADESGSWTAIVAQMDGAADKSQTRFVWAVNKRCQLIRFRFTLSGAAASFQPKRLEMYVRPSQRQ